MNLSRPRFTMRRMMIAVALVAIALGIEIQVAAYSRNLVSEHGDGVDYIQSEAVIVWATLNAMLFFLIAFSVLIGRAALKDKAEAEQVSDEVGPPQGQQSGPA